MKAESHIPENISYAEAAALCCCHKQPIRAAVLAGRIAAHRPGRQYQLCLIDVVEWYGSTRLPGSKRAQITAIPETWTLTDAASACGCGKQQLMQSIADGDIDAYKPGKSIQLDKAQTISWWHSTKIQPRRAGRPRRMAGRSAATATR